MTRIVRIIRRRVGRSTATLRREDGASLIMVIIFVMVFGVITSVILDFAGSGFRETQAIGAIRSRLHTADGGVDGAINAIRSSQKGYTSAGACPDFTLPATASDPAVVVSCTPSGSSGGIFDQQPAWALLTLGKASGEGVIKTGNFHTVIAGGVFSSKDATMTGGPNCKDVNDDSCNALTVLGDAIALGDCLPNSGSPSFTPTRLFTSAGSDETCLRGASDPVREARGTDPGYPTAIGYPAALDAQTPAQVVTTFGGSVDPPATCQAGNKVVKFAPGLYSQKLDSLIPAACKNTATTWWLSPSDTSCTPSTPGMYYLDFPDGNATWDLSISNASVVGGKLTSGCSVVSGKSTATAVPTVPGGCVENTSGVELLFGGESNMVVKGNTYQLDLCASPADATITNQRIVMYGLPSGTKDAPVSGVVMNAASANSATFINASSAITTDSTCTPSAAVPLPCAHADMHGGAAGGAGAVKTATINFPTFADIPVGSTITAATLEVAHREQGPQPFTIGATWNSVDTFSQTASPTTQPCTSTGSPPTLTPSSPSNTFHTDACPLLPAFGASPFGPYGYRTFNGLNSVSLSFSANLADAVAPTCNNGGNNCHGGSAADTATVDVDSLVLRVSYIPPGFEATRCPVATSCALFASSNSPITELLGTVYAPTARFDIDVHNRNFTNFSRGVIVRTLNLNASASDKQTDQSPISLPGDTSSGVRIVTFTATIGGNTRLRARVRYTDKDPLGADFAGYKVEILNWEVVR